MDGSVRTEEEAAAWLARQDRAQWHDTDQAAFTEWLAASNAHRIAYIRLAAAWQRVARLKDLATADVVAGSAVKDCKPSAFVQRGRSSAVHQGSESVPPTRRSR